MDNVLAGCTFCTNSFRLRMIVLYVDMLSCGSYLQSVEIGHIPGELLFDNKMLRGWVFSRAMSGRVIMPDAHFIVAKSKHGGVLWSNEVHSGIPPTHQHLGFGGCSLFSLILAK